MADDSLAREIREKALSLGYEKCGIIKVEEMSEYGDALASRIDEYPSDRPFLERLRAFADVRQIFPWAKSLIVLVIPYGQYRIPPGLEKRIVAAYLCGGLHVEGHRDNKASVAFGAYLAEKNLRAATDRKHGFTAMRWAAAKAGVGIVRKNNFLYTESGSSAYLSVWAIDAGLELKEEARLKPCPDGCTRCVDACPTKSLRQPFSMRPMTCVSFMTGFGGELKDNPLAPSMGDWIYGCDACQSACPFNRLPGRKQIEAPELETLSEQAALSRIIEMDYKTIEELFAKKFWYISVDNLWKWKVNALNAMKNSYTGDYMPWIEKALHDPAEQVRSMAAWVMRNAAGENRDADDR